jgi:3-hydroxymyristoyl/3-hydroxydecanoyl-(acyl carrier protein) dehydratase
LGSSEQELFDGLANVEYGYTLNPAFKPEKAGDFNRIVDKLAASSYGMVGAAHLKFLEPVFPGNPVEFEASLSGTLGDYQNFQVEAFVNGRTKVKGTLSSIKGMGVSSMLDAGN